MEKKWRKIVQIMEMEIVPGDSYYGTEDSEYEIKRLFCTEAEAKAMVEALSESEEDYRIRYESYEIPLTATIENGREEVTISLSDLREMVRQACELQFLYGAQSGIEVREIPESLIKASDSLNTLLGK